MAPNRIVAAAAVAGALGLATTAALAHTAKGEQPATAGAKAAHLRHEKMERLGKTFKGLNDELKKKSANKTAVASHARTMKALAEELPGWFPKGSGQEARPKSEARAEIWSDAAGFSTVAANLRTQTAKLNDLAAAGDLEGVKTQVRATGGACKACHDKYRVEKKKS
jgi:cytochrome c556